MSGAGRAALVTGGARRIGAAISRALAADGWRVVIHHHSATGEADDLARELRAQGHDCTPLRADLGDRAAIESLFARATEIAGPIGCLVNNAARFEFDDIASVGWDSLQAHMVPNLVAPLLLSQAFAAQPALAEPGGAGTVAACIINIIDQKIGNLNPDFLSYTLSKLALAGLTDMLAMALAGRVRVCGISPGLTLISGKQTEASFQRGWAATPLGRNSTPDEIATCVRYILATPSLTGQTITLDGGESLRGRARDVALDPSV